MNDGHTVVGDRRAEDRAAARRVRGRRHRWVGASLFRPIRDIREVYESLDDRVMAGFGGVAEYGITVRWNKNFLKIIRLLLERRREFSMFGGVRFGGTLTIDSAFEMGFDHVALCAGAGRPTVIPMKNGLARGVRQASDFLMALQLTGAAKTNSVANLQIRMPLVVIGGGLTADRYGHRIARLLRGAGGEIPEALRNAGSRKRRSRSSRRMEHGRDPRPPMSFCRTRAPFAPSARPRLS